MSRGAKGPNEHDRSLLDSIIRTAPDAIITIDASGIILSFSPAATRIFGYEEHEIVGRNVRELMPEPHRGQHDSYLRRYQETGERRIIGIGRQVRATRKSGEVFHAELAVGEIGAGDETIYTGFLRDVTVRSAAQRRAARLQRALEQLGRSQMLGEMSSALAHELNQPLTAIANFASAAARELDQPAPDTGRSIAHLERIAEQARRAGEIIRRMRQLVERGRTNPVPDNINEIVREALRSYVGPETIEPHFELKLADDLPDVLADRIQIQQVIINLVRNAQEACLDGPDNEVHIATALSDPSPVRLRAVSTNSEEVMVTVSDDGPGLPAEISDRLFEPLVTDKEYGIGVGLAVCRSIIQAHGGRIWAENGAHGGAEFHFTLPVAHQ